MAEGSFVDSMGWTPVELLGIVAGFFTTLAFLPQVIKVWKTRETKDLSLAMFVLFLAGVLLWTIYGLIQMSPSIILANGVTFVLSMYILIMKIRHG